MTEFPDWFFERSDPGDDARFYLPPRFVLHIDEGAVAAVTELYAELDVGGRVLDLMSSWVSHLHRAPDELVVLGMNAAELAANAMATERVVQDLNRDPVLPFPDADFDAVLCVVSIDYLIRPVEVLAECARVLRAGAPLAITFSNRCFPTKAIEGWLATDDAGRCAIVVDYLRRAGGFETPSVSQRVEGRGDPLYAVVATRSG